MRDLGTLVWVVLVFVGVVSSMISTIRKQAQRQSPAHPAPPGGPTRVRFAVPAPPTAAPQPPVPQQPPQAVPPAKAQQPSQEPRRLPLFAGRGQLVRAVIAAEVLGKPRGLHDEHFPR